MGCGLLVPWAGQAWVRGSLLSVPQHLPLLAKDVLDASQVMQESVFIGALLSVAQVRLEEKIHRCLFHLFFL